ncbi:MAG: ComEA family DNA-binding protein [Lachnospiraceae bacterium]|nr:ComEA family DNA-binding protein [Lachnospiraceae bacterium]
MIHKNKFMLAVVILLSMFTLCSCFENDTDFIYPKEHRESETVTSGQQEEMVGQVSETEGEVFVQVCGAVRTPGVYKVSSTLRVFQAIEAAGGVTEQADINAVNLARPVTDEMYIYIPTVAEVQENSGVDDGTETFSEPGNNKININTATREELMTLKGIGEAKADAIIMYREETGGFTEISQIMNISGIKEAAFNKIKDSIAVE